MMEEKVIEKLKQNNFLFKKKFGQNFITDTNLLDAIVGDADINENDEVLEIGTGAGTLTKALAKKCKKVLTLEIDHTLGDFLKSEFESFDNIELCFADFMKVSPFEINKHFEGHYKVVANLPYYITTPIICKLLEEKYNATSLTIMVQKEVAERLTGESGTKDYGSITAWANSIADVEYKRTVNRKMFTPSPNVDSAIVNIKINKNKYHIKNLKLHQKVIETAFSMRRKTLVNCFKSKMNLTEEQIKDVFDKVGLSPLIRGEVLDPEHFVELSNTICDLY